MNGRVRVSKLDGVRRRIQALLLRDAVTLSEVSRAIGRNHAYMQQFMRRGTPKTLPEDVRLALADYFDVDEAELRAPRGGEADDQAGADGAESRRVPRSFAARLSVARAESVFETPSSFAEAAGIDRLRYADLEDGDDTPTLQELDQIARCSGKSLDWLIRGETSQPTAPFDMTASFGGEISGRDNLTNMRGRRKKRITPP